MISLPEWLVVGVLGVLVAVIGWGIQRMVASYDCMSRSIVEMTKRVAGIEQQMIVMNGRISKGEKWQEDRT